MTTFSSSSCVIVWFRNDLRISDNPALLSALKTGHPVLPVFVLDETSAGEWFYGAASRVWLYHSLSDLKKKIGGTLLCLHGNTETSLQQITSKYGARQVFWNRCYEPWRRDLDKKVTKILQEDGIDCHQHNGNVLWEPDTVLKSDGTPYKIFTPYYQKGCLSHSMPPAPLPSPENIFLFSGVSVEDQKKFSISSLPILPQNPEQTWNKTVMESWTVGEDSALTQLDIFLNEKILGYKSGRDYMAEDNVSRLSPHLEFGEISVRKIWHTVQCRSEIEQNTQYTQQSESFLRQLVWRDFSHYLLYHCPSLPDENFHPRFNRFPWRKSEGDLTAWKRGMTGYPVVDAAMRELWQTGTMHNRARMIAGSFLCKHLLLHWKEGEKWFWDCLLDASLANNAQGWQWISGTGADAAPYFRIFNPVLQGEKFDPSGTYVRRYVPEISALPDCYIHKPWEAPDGVLRAAGITLDKTYPAPIVDHAQARDRALDSFQKTK